MQRLVIAKASGRLGNQLFQILGLVCNCNNNSHIIYLLGYDRQCLDILRLPPHIKLIQADSLLHKACIRLSNCFVGKILTRIFVIVAREEANEPKISYIYPFISLPFSPIVFDNIYFQKSALVNDPKTLEQLSIRTQFLLKCKELISTHLDGENTKHCLVHIRRTDYCFWPSREHRAVLPISYYIKSVAAAHATHLCRNFILCSDDIDYAYDLAHVLRGTTSLAGCTFKVVDTSPILLIGMILVSPIKIISSSFSWAAALLGVNYYSSNHIAVYAPMYWSGHRQKRWYPSNSFWDKATYIEVDHPECE